MEITTKKKKNEQRIMAPARVIMITKNIWLNQL